MSGYTRVPNEVFKAMPEMGKAELKCTLALVRQTYGYNRDTAKVKYSDFKILTGMSRQGIADGLKAVWLRGLFTHESQSQWRIVYLLDYSGREKSSNQTKIVKQSDYNSLVTRLSTSSPKDTIKDTIKDSSSTPVESLMRRFTQITAISPPHDTTDAYKDKWLKPLKDLIAFNAELAERRLEEAINILRSKRFTIASPASIYKTAVNWFPESAVKPNGADAAWSQLWTGDGWKAPQDSRGKATVKAMGGMPRFKNSQARERSFLEKEFKSAY